MWMDVDVKAATVREERGVASSDALDNKTTMASYGQLLSEVKVEVMLIV